MATHARFINPPGLQVPRGYTQVVEAPAGRTVYISGQIALDAEGNVVGPNDMRAQTERVFENLKVALAAVGATFDHVVKANIYFVDITQIPIVREIRDRYFNPASPPASTAVEVRRLAREEFLIEIEVVAVIPAA